MRHDTSAVAFPTSKPVQGAVYAVWGDDEDYGPCLCRWPSDRGVYATFDAAAELARRAAGCPSMFGVEIWAYVGKEGADFILHEWQQEEIRNAQRAANDD